MKLNRLFLLAAMGLGLFACNDNDLVEGSAPNGTLRMEHRKKELRMWD